MNKNKPLRKEQIKGPWTHFYDMHSGGGTKEGAYEHIYIQAPKEMAEIIFQNKFGHNPNRVSCTCCGGDYSISESFDLRQATGHQRGCSSLETKRSKNGLYLNDDPILKKHYYLEPTSRIPKGYKLSRIDFKIFKYRTLTQYIQEKNVLLVFATEIEEHQRHGELKEQGYVWLD